MYLVTGLYTGDCYETPESVIRLMAVNMERLRWVNGSSNNSIAINIPSNSLSYYTKDTVYTFKAGNVSHLALGYPLTEFTISNGIVLLHQTNNTLSFPVEGRQLIKGDLISVHNAGKLASLLVGHPVNKHVNRLYKLPRPMPLHVTYYTCEMRNGVLITYHDTRYLDGQLEKALYHLK